MASNSHPICNVLFWTDPNGTPGSRTLALVSHRSRAVMQTLEKAILRGDIRYGDSRSITKQLMDFRMDWNSGDNRKKMNEKLRGAFLDTVVSGIEYMPPELRKKEGLTHVHNNSL